jgi:hypothetical protein
LSDSCGLWQASPLAIGPGRATCGAEA